MIGTLATEAGRQGITTYMMTPDKDYGQLVSDNVFMYRPKAHRRIRNHGYGRGKDEFSIQSTAQVIDMLGLMGDASDNIPGCPGVGEKTAQKLIAEFGSIENLLEHTDQLKGALKTKVETNREMITFSKFLATIKQMFPFSSTWIRSSAKNRTKKNSARFSRSWNSAHSSTGYLKMGSGNSSSPTPTSPVPGPLCRDSVCPVANLHSRKAAPRFKAICLQIFAGEGTGVSENFKA